MARGKKKESALTPEEKLAQALVPVEEQPYKVPGNWCWVKLSSLSSLISKGTTPTGGKTAYIPEGVHFLRVENINDDGTISHDNIACVTEEMHTGFLKRSMLENRDVLVSIAGTLGKTGIVRDVDLPLNTNQAVAFIRLKTEFVNEKYIKAAIDNPIVQELLLGKTKVTSIPNLTLEIIGDCPIPLAPTAEQKCIVDRIEYLFAKLDEAKEKAQSVLDSFETRKAAILHKAFTGELTAKWRSEQGLGVEHWRSEYFKDICEKITDGTHHSPPNTDEGEYMYVTAKNIKEYGVDLSNITYVSKDVHDEIFARCDVSAGDVLYIKDGATTGIATVNTITEPFSLLSSVAVLRPLSGIVDPYYMAYHLNSSETKAMMINNMSGNAITRLTLAKIKNAQITVCSIDEQQEIVRILDSLFVKEQQAKEAAEAVLEKIDLLKKSILARAFRGELGTNDPTEESAMELLKTIL